MQCRHSALHPAERSHFLGSQRPIEERELIVPSNVVHAEPDRGFSKVEGQVDQPAPNWPGFADAVASARRIGTGFRSTLSWASFDANLEGCETGADARVRPSRHQNLRFTRP